MPATVRYIPGADDPAIGRWRGHVFQSGMAVTVRNESLLAEIEAQPGFVVEHSPRDRIVTLAEKESARTSPEVASLAAKLMHHDEPDVRKVAASALAQAV